MADRAPERVAWEAGREACPGIDLPFEAFERTWRAGDGVARPGDAYLAAACAEGVPGAFEALGRSSMPRVRAFLVARGATPDEADALIRDLPGHLVERPRAGEPSRIGTYAARSSLVTWLSIVAWRLLGERRRRAGMSPPLPDRDPSDHRAVRPIDALVGKESAAALASAFQAAWGRLTPREALALLLRYRDGWSQREIAGIMGVGEPRVSRLLEAGVQRIRDALRESPSGVSWEALRDSVASRLASFGGSSL